MCKISIIVPLYNGECTIGRCLDSLINQTIDDIEVVVVDDGSKDEGPDIVRKYIEKDNRIRLITQENKGSGAARNCGINEAKGKYVGFLDCDDFVDTKMYQIMVNALEQTGEKVAICQEKNVYLDKGETQFISETRFPVNDVTVFSSEQILEWQLNYTYMSLNSMCYEVLERTVFIDNSIRVPEMHRYAEDLVTSVGIFTHVDNVVIVPQSLYYYVHAKESRSYAYSLRHAEDIYTDWKEVCEYIKQSNKKVNIDNFSLGMFFSSMKHICWITDKREKKNIQVKIIKDIWKNEKKKNKWKPNFAGKYVPFLHKIKILVAYLELCRPVFMIIKLLSWVPFFKYMV